MRKGKLFAASLLALGLLGMADAEAQSGYARGSKLATGSWHKIAVAEAGIYTITTADVAQLLGTPCSGIALFGAAGGMLNASNMASHPDDLVPAAIEVVDVNGNGTFEAEDCILFYGEGAGVWRYNSSDKLFEYTPHAYAIYNYYFLTTGYSPADSALRLQTATYTATTSAAIGTYTAVALYHEERLNPVEGGPLWMADRLSASLPSRSYALTLPQAPEGGHATVRYGLAHISNYSGQFGFEAGGETWANHFDAYTTYNTFSRSIATTSSRVEMELTYTPRESGAMGYLDFIELSAEVPLTYLGGQQLLRCTQQEGAVGWFEGTGYAEGLRLWDVSEPSQPRNIPLQSSGGSGFGFAAPTATPRTFVAFTQASAMHPGSIEAVPNQDIHGAEVPDYVIVTHRAFEAQAEKLANLHRAQEGLVVLVVDQEEVFNEYSSGRPDPIAIRQMMRNLRAKDPSGQKPRHLLLFGKGTYDNRNILGSNQLCAITYQYGGSTLSDVSAYPSDDVYGYLDDNTAGVFEGSLSVGIGRLPAKTVAEAEHLVDKIEGYMSKRDFAQSGVRGDWRNQVTLLADDADPSTPGDTVFASDAEKMAQSIRAKYPELNIDKIYADAYIQQSGASGSYYPEVNNALRQRMNYGTLLLNYIGHGSDKYIGTERYMEFSDIEQYSNTDRLAFFVTSTCSFGHYDLVDDICGAEAFLLAKAAGVGILTAARPIHHSHPFNSRACLYALDASNTIGEALLKAKNEVSVAHCIALLGDPALRLSIPTGEVVVTRINGHLVDPETTDSAQVLSRVEVEGEIRGSDGTLDTGFDGTIYPIVFDRQTQSSTLANDNDSTEVEFLQQKSILYKGRQSVSGGRFAYSFVIPKDVSYHYDYAKLSHYARSSNNNDASGQYSNIMFGGLDQTAEPTGGHPSVRLYIGDTNFRSGGLTNETPTVYAILADSAGINTAGSGIGHDITATIDGNPYSTVILNDYYEPSILDSRYGEVRYTLGKLEDGPHTLTIKCWNIFNLSGSATIDFVVANDRQQQIGQLSATPNPAHERTSIRIEHNAGTAVLSATVDIYDIRGAHLRQLHAAATTDGSCVVALPWDFRAANGTQVPCGVYVARATLVTSTGDMLTQTAKVVRN